MKHRETMLGTLAIKIVNFSATAEASVARNFVWALPNQKGTII